LGESFVASGSTAAQASFKGARDKTSRVAGYRRQEADLESVSFYNSTVGNNKVTWKFSVNCSV
jgi:hypothetical protein